LNGGFECCTIAPPGAAFPAFVGLPRWPKELRMGPLTINNDLIWDDIEILATFSAGGEGMNRPTFSDSYASHCQRSPLGDGATPNILKRACGAVADHSGLTGTDLWSARPFLYADAEWRGARCPSDGTVGGDWYDLHPKPRRAQSLPEEYFAPAQVEQGI
jgi:hypothetical protein